MLTKTKPYEHQLTAYNKAYAQKFFALFMEMGTGKTKVSIDLASNYFNEMKIDAVLVVAPNSVHRQWAEEEIPKHCPVPYTTIAWSATKYKTQKYKKELYSFILSDKLKFFCVNVETFASKSYIPIVKKFLTDNRCLMIIDESTTIKNPEAKRTQKLIALGELPVKKLILTGTPVTNSPFDIWGQFNYLDYGFFHCDFFMFQHKYGMMIREKRDNYLGEEYTCIRNMSMWEIAKYKGLVEKNRRDHIDKKKGEEILVKALDFDDAIEKVHLTSGVSEKTLRYIATHDDIKYPYKGLEHIKKLIDPYTYVVKKEDCKDVNIPEKIFSPMHVDMTPEQRRIYKSTKRDMLATYNGDDLTVKNKLSLMLRLQQITGGFFPPDPELGEVQEPKLIGKKTAKFARIETDLHEVDPEEKVIIWCRFTHEIRYLRREIKKLYPEDRIETYYGETSNKAEVKKDFMDGKVRFLIANKQSAGIGLNLQKSTLHYDYSKDFSLERDLQAQDRSHRIGQTRHVVYKNTIIRDSIDVLIDSALTQKKDLLEFFREKSLNELLSGGEIIF